MVRGRHLISVSVRDVDARGRVLPARTGNANDLAALVEAGIVPGREEHATGRRGFEFLVGVQFPPAIPMDERWMAHHRAY